MKFFKPKYLIRLDDASHFSNIEKWRKVVNILNLYNVKPMVAVIPNNMDNNIKYSFFNENFWSMVKKWQIKGWTIAMHGYNHVYHKCNRLNLIFPFYNRSEFAGLSLEVQLDKLKKSSKIFTQNDIKPEVWIAPSHSFDQITLKALNKATDINIISDGISYSNYYYKGFHFIPQQLWNFKNKFFGLWTICLHPDTMNDNEINELELFLKDKTSKDQIIGLENINFKEKGKDFLGRIFSAFFWTKYNIKIVIKKLLNI